MFANIHWIVLTRLRWVSFTSFDGLYLFFAIEYYYSIPFG